jgi:transposase InsO family protein
MPWKTNSFKEQRWKFIQEFLRNKSGFSELCRGWGISRKTGYKWIDRFKARGRWGLADRPREAHEVHNRPTEQWLGRVRRWRGLHPSWGAPKLRWVLRRRFGQRGLPSESGIGRWLKRWGLSRKRRRAAHKGPSIDRPALTCPQKPNDVWTVDFKGWFRTADGVRVDPLTVRDLASRYILAIRLRREQSVEDCRREFERIFRKYGLPLVIRSDNGSPFGAIGALGLTRLSAWWMKLGIKVEFIDPGSPYQNGAHEQFHRVYLEEAVQPAAASVRAQQMRSERWRRHYNRERPHEGIGMRVPAQLYRKSRRTLPRPMKHWRYPRGWESRLVKGKGMISYHGRSRFIGEAFEGERVGIKWVQTGVQEVYYGSHLVGELWDRDGTSGIRAVWYRKAGAKSRPGSSPPGSVPACFARLHSAGRRTASSSV